MKEKELWYNYIKNYIDKNKYDYAVSWHIRIDLERLYNYSTQKINYEINKLVKDGLLRKETNVYCTKYYLTDKNYEKSNYWSFAPYEYSIL